MHCIAFFNFLCGTCRAQTGGSAQTDVLLKAGDSGDGERNCLKYVPDRVCEDVFALERAASHLWMLVCPLVNCQQACKECPTMVTVTFQITNRQQRSDLKFCIVSRILMVPVPSCAKVNMQSISRPGMRHCHMRVNTAPSNSIIFSMSQQTSTGKPNVKPDQRIVWAGPELARIGQRQCYLCYRYDVRLLVLCLPIP